MFSREESKKIRQEFWTSFGKEYPQKWLLYNTKIKDFTLKFTFTTQKAQVSIDIEPDDEIVKAYYFEKLVSLKSIVSSEYLPNILYDEHYALENGKIISRIYVQLEQVNIHNKNHWPAVMEFLSLHMSKLEDFFLAYKDVIDD